MVTLQNSYQQNYLRNTRITEATKWQKYLWSHNFSVPWGSISLVPDMVQDHWTIVVSHWQWCKSAGSISWEMEWHHYSCNVYHCIHNSLVRRCHSIELDHWMVRTRRSVNKARMDSRVNQHFLEQAKYSSWLSIENRALLITHNNISLKHTVRTFGYKQHENFLFFFKPYSIYSVLCFDIYLIALHITLLSNGGDVSFTISTAWIHQTDVLLARVCRIRPGLSALKRWQEN